MKIVHFDPLDRQREIPAELQNVPGVECVTVRSEPALAAALSGAEALVIGNRFYTAEIAKLVRSEGSQLKWIQFTSSGFDKALANGLPSGIVVTNMAGVRGFAVAEHAFFLMLALARQARIVEQAQSEERWARVSVTPTLINLADKKLVLIGVGSIAREIARRARAFEMHVTGISRVVRGVEDFDVIRPRAEIGPACAEADFIILTASYDATSHNLLDKEVISRLKSSAFVINVARGPLLDEQALVQALNSERLRGAGLDVTQLEPLPPGHELWRAKNLVLTPHIAGAGSSRPTHGIGRAASTNVKRWISGEPLLNVAIDRTP